MIKRVIPILLLIAMLISLASGCSGSKTPSTQQESSVSQEASAEQKTVSKEKVKITFLQMEPQFVEGYKWLAEEFNKANPDIILEEPVMLDDDALIRTKLNSGEMCDMFNTSPYEGNKTFFDHIVDLTNEPFVKNLEPLSLPSVTLDGKIMGVPLDFNSYAFIYSKKAFAKAGITKLPETLAELEDACKQLKSAGITPFATGYKEHWILGHIFSYFMTSQPGYDTGSNYHEIVSGSKTFADLPHINDYFDLIDLTLKYSIGKDLDMGWQEIEKALCNDEVAMFHMGVWCEDFLLQNNPNVDVGFLPVPIGDKKDRVAISSDIAWVVRIYNKSKHINECKTFLNWLTSSEQGKRFVPEKMKKIGTFKGAPAPASMLGSDAAKYISAGKSYPWLFQTWPTGFWLDAGKYVQTYVAKEVDRKTCIENITSVFKKLSEK